MRIASFPQASVRRRRPVEEESFDLTSINTWYSVKASSISSTYPEIARLLWAPFMSRFAVACSEILWIWVDIVLAFLNLMFERLLVLHLVYERLEYL